MLVVVPSRVLPFSGRGPYPNGKGIREMLQKKLKTAAEGILTEPVDTVVRALSILTLAILVLTLTLVVTRNAH